MTDDVRATANVLVCRRQARRSFRLAFFQAWLFFGVLTEVSNLCGLDIDLATYFILATGWMVFQGDGFEAAVRNRRAGDKVLMEGWKEVY